MAEFDFNFVSIVFGFSGTLILLFSSILSYRKKIKEKEKFSLMSQMIGFLFLFDSFIYLLWPKISSQFYSVPPPTNFSYWPYYLFIGAGIIISLFLVKEKVYVWGRDVYFNVEDSIEIAIFYSPAIFAFVALIINSDFILILNLFVWFR